MLSLRDHPLMSHYGRKIWPPRWTTTRTDKDGTPSGEVGMLREALMNDLFSNQLFLVIEYNGNRYMGCMTFGDSVFCYQIYALLKLKPGCSIREIGDLDLSHLL